MIRVATNGKECTVVFACNAIHSQTNVMATKRTKDEVYRHLSIDVEESTTDDNDEEVEWSVGKGIAKFFRKETREVICEKCPEGKTATQTQSVLEW